MTDAPIVVAGDICRDWLAWSVPASPGATANSHMQNGHMQNGHMQNWHMQPGTRMVARRGGALLLADMLRHATTRPVIGPHGDAIGDDQVVQSLIDLHRDGPAAFRITRLRGFSGPEHGAPARPVLEREVRPTAAVLVLDDAGNGFRDNQSGWGDMLARLHPARLVVKMARPLATGALWDAVRHGPVGPDGLPDANRLVVVLNADDLRAEGIALSHRLSWERTAEDFVRQLASNGRLDTLVTCAHLLVRFGCEGVIHHRGRGDQPPVLFFDPRHAEGEFAEAHAGAMVGTTAAFTAGLAAALADDPDMDRAVRAGMAAAHHLAATGFQADADGRPDYPRAAVFAAPSHPPVIALSLPRARIVQGAAWSILDDVLGDPLAAARRVVTEGPSAALHRIPTARFGALLTADRREIESFRAIGNLLREYLAAPRARPISIGVFGPPGAGKSFGVQQVAQAALGRRPDVLEFNLSQFTALADLTAAFHLVRDRAVRGEVPLVFFDEFDSPFDTQFGGDLGWLRYFLAPMQDGNFREGGHAHPLGAAIFVFAGGTRASFSEFAAPMDPAPKTGTDHPDRARFIAAKGPDFASRLRGYVDILGPDPTGPDPTGPDDRLFPIRRALLLRALLQRHHPSLASNGHFNIEDGVLNALLTVPAYRHGVRSMEALLAMSTLAGRGHFAAADLPPPAQLALHVDPEPFLARVAGERLDDDRRHRLGRLLHEAYRQQRLAIAETDQERHALAQDSSMRDWADLPAEFRESSARQADDIPRKLRRIGCFMAPDAAAMAPVGAFTDAELALLAEHEHERWNAERLQSQWRLDARDTARHTSAFLIPWRDLAPKWRSLDEAMVAAIPRVLRADGLQVFRSG